MLVSISNNNFTKNELLTERVIRFLVYMNYQPIVHFCLLALKSSTQNLENVWNYTIRSRSVGLFRNKFVARKVWEKEKLCLEC